MKALRGTIKIIQYVSTLKKLHIFDSYNRGFRSMTEFFSTEFKGNTKALKEKNSRFQNRTANFFQVKQLDLLLRPFILSIVLFES